MLSHPAESGLPFTALALNWHLPGFFGQLWESASTRVCADGGANRVFDFFGGKTFKAPDLVCGDFDSLKPVVRSTFEKGGTDFVTTTDQDFNDMQKCLWSILEKDKKSPVIVFGAWGGRFDHTAAALSAALAQVDLRIYFLDEDNFATWVKPGDKGIVCPQKWTTKMCGLLPIAGPVKKITTKGLEWDCDFGLEMGGLISSSNEIKKGCDRVEIETSDPVLWVNKTRKLNELPI